MKDIPFYITPEEFDVHEQEFIQQLKEAEPKQYWNCANSENPGRYFMLRLSVLIGVSMTFFYFISMLVFVYLSDQEIAKALAFFLSPTGFLFAVIMCGMCYLFFGLDNLYHYHLSEKGLLMERHQHIPKFAYSILRGIAWIGCVVSVMAMAKFGAAAFAGAGGSLLLAFGLTRMKQDVFSENLNLNDILRIEYHVERKVARVFHRYQSCRYYEDNPKGVYRVRTFSRMLIFCNEVSQLHDLIKQLTEHGASSIDVVEIDNQKLFFDGGGIPQSIKDRINPVTAQYNLLELELLRGQPTPEASEFGS